MRWFVEISTSESAEAQERLVVEAAQWQPAILAARASRGESGGLTGFAIEILDDGFRAVDPRTRVRYLVRRAPDDTPLTGTSAPSSDTGSSPSQLPQAAGTPEPQAAPSEQAATGDSTAAALLYERKEPATAETRLTYREAAWALEAEASIDVAKSFLLARFDEIVRELSGVRPGRLVNLAVFDHSFTGKPLRPPVATLTWKDWQGPAPDIRSTPAPIAPEPTPTPELGPEPTATAAPPSEPPPASTPASELTPTATPEPAPTHALPPTPEPEPKPEPEPTPTPAPPSAPAPEPASALPTPAEPTPTPEPEPLPTPPEEPQPAPENLPKPRLAGDELLTELFETMHDLHWLDDAIEGANFVLSLALDKLPSAIGMVQFYDLPKRQLVVVRAAGPEAAQALLHRTADTDPLVARAMRGPVVLADASQDPRVQAGRFAAFGLPIASLVSAPIEQDSRFFGLIELANPEDGQGFTEADGNAIAYMGQQLAQLIIDRGIVLDPARIRGA